MLRITRALREALQKTNVELQIAIEIDGIRTISSTGLLEYIRIGDPGLLIGSYLGAPWVIGGLRPLGEDANLDVLSLSKGTSTSLQQQLQPDRGIATSPTTLNARLIDFYDEISEIISPGFVVTDILGKRCKVRVGEKNTSYPQDFVTVFRGTVGSIKSGAGFVDFTLKSTDQRKRQTVFQRRTTDLLEEIPASGALTGDEIELASAEGFPFPVLGPDSTYDPMIKYYVRIGDEYFRYTGITGNTLTGVTVGNRSQFASSPSLHEVGDTVDSMVVLEGNGVKMAQKLMQSGWNGPCFSAVEIENFVRIDPVTAVPNAIFFQGVNVEDEYGLTRGDYITTTGASNGANNVTLKTIDRVVTLKDGSYVIVNGVSFVEEIGTPATVEFRSQYDTLGVGIKMRMDEVDNAEHDRLYSLFLSSFNMRFYVTDGIDGKDFSDQRILRPMGCWSLPRKGRSSIAIHIQPLPETQIITLNVDNVKDPDKLVLARSDDRHFYNTITYDIDKPLDGDRFAQTITREDENSKNDIDIGDKVMKIEAEGMRVDLSGINLAIQAANRYLNRYKRGAESIPNVGALLADCFQIEIGDSVLVDTAGLKITDTREGDRSGSERFFQVENLKMDLRNGNMTFDLVDSNFSTANRYGLIGPSSHIKSALSQTIFNIELSYAFEFEEYEKWERFGQINVRVRSPSLSDWLPHDATRRIEQNVNNEITLQSALGFTPDPGDVMEIPDYNDADPRIKLRYVFMRNSLVVAFTAATDEVTLPLNHNYLNGYDIQFHTVVGTTTVLTNTTYYVRDVTATSCKISRLQNNGPVLNIDVDGTGTAESRFDDGGKQYRMI